MKTSHILSVLAISASFLLGGAATAQGTSGSMDSASATQQSEWLSVPDLLKRLEAAGYTDFQEIERDKDGYWEVKALDREGRRVEIDVHPVTGEVLKTELKREKR